MLSSELIMLNRHRQGLLLMKRHPMRSSGPNRCKSKPDGETSCAFKFSSRSRLQRIGSPGT